MFSCSNGDVDLKNEHTDVTALLTEKEIKALSLLQETHSVSDEAAMSEVESVMELLNNDDIKRSGEIKDRRLSSVKKEYVKPSKNFISRELVLKKMREYKNNRLHYRSNEESEIDESEKENTEAEDVPLYVFNFSDSEGVDAGFAIVSGDDRTDSVLAVVSDGRLNSENDNPGLAVFVTRIPDYIDSKIEEYNSIDVADLESALEKIEDSAGSNYSESDLPEALSGEIITRGSSTTTTFYGA